MYVRVGSEAAGNACPTERSSGRAPAQKEWAISWRRRQEWLIPDVPERARDGTTRACHMAEAITEAYQTMDKVLPRGWPVSRD